MGDVGDDMRALRAYRKENHEKWYSENMRVLSESGLSMMVHETAVLFREPGKPKIDFYPHTGRWKAGNKMMRGGAKAFLAWYHRQREAANGRGDSPSI